MLKKIITPLLAASALAMTVPAHAAGSEDRARVAIAEAKAKIETAESLGASSSLPHETADARAALAQAQEHFKSDHNEQSIEAAIRAESIADAAIGQLQQDNKQAAADSDAQANMAANQAAAAHQKAEDANARAAAAERSAAISAQQAAAANSQTETTVTTQPRARSSTSTTVTRKTQPTTSGQVTTTTTVKEPSR
jgi:hypothetical protein